MPCRTLHLVASRDTPASGRGVLCRALNSERAGSVEHVRIEVDMPSQPRRSTGEGSARKRRCKWFALLAMTAAALTPTPSAAQTTYYWNGGNASASPANGGTGTWNTTTANWRQATDTGSAVAWPGTSSGADSAVFAGTSGTVTLSGSLVANALSFTVDAYTLTGGTLGLDGTAPSLSVTTGTATIESRLVGSGSLTKTGVGTLTLSGANSYSGGTTVSGGILRLASTTAAGSGAVALAGGTLSLFRSAATTTYANAINVAAGQAGTLSVDGSGTNASTYTTGTITVDGALTVTRTSGSTANTTFDARLVGSGTLVVDNTNGGTTPVSGVSQGRALFQRNDNTFSGDVVIRNGGNFLNNTLNPSYGSVDIGANSLLTLVATSGTTTTTVGTLTGAGTVIRNNSPGTQTTLSVGAGSFSGVISSGTLFGGAGTIALTKTGTGTLTLSGSNAYSGGTTVSGGILRLTSTTAAGSGAVALAGGTLSLFRSAATTTYANAINVAAGQAGTLSVDGSGTNAGTSTNSTYATGTLAADGTLTVSRATGGTGNTSFNGVLVGSGTLVVDNTNGGVIPVNGTSVGRALFNSTSNTFSGDVVIRNGGNFLNNTLNPSYGSVDIGVNSLLTLVAQSGTPTTTTVGTLTGAGTVIRNNSSGNQTTLSVGRGNFSGVISSGTLFGGVGTIALTKTGTGTLVLGGGNTYTGATTISGGILQIGNGGTAGALSGSSAIFVESAATLAFSRSNTITQGTDFSSVISGSGGITQLGAGTLVLNGVNTYSGRTLVSAGVLALGVNGSFANSNEIKVGDAGSSGAILDLTAKTAAFAIGAGQMLSGGGTMLIAPGQQFLVEGTFSPGNSPGLFTFDGGTTVLSGTTVMELFGTSRATAPSHGSGFYDAVNIVDNGMLQFGGKLTLEFSGLFDNKTAFDLFTPASGSTLAGNFTGVTVIGGFYTGLEWNQTGSLWKSSSTTAGQSLEFSAVTGQLVIVPEPSTIALLAAAGGIALLHRNRRRSARRKTVPALLCPSRIGLGPTLSNAMLQQP